MLHDQACVVIFSPILLYLMPFIRYEQYLVETKTLTQFFPLWK